jgi:DNA-binding Lrp family transcriptional regulator
MNKQHFPSLDSLDIRLMAELEADARQTYKDLAAKLGVSRPTITNRVKRLLESGVIRVICWTNPVALGYKFTLTLLIDAHPGQIGDVADKLKACPQILHIHLCTGRFNIVAWALFRDSEGLSEFILKDLGSISGIMHVETMFTLQEVKMSPRLLTDAKEPHPPESLAKDLDELDLKLITELQTNVGQKARHLAQKLGVYESTILRRIQRLVNENIIRIITVIHPLAMGYEGIAIIGLKCNPDKVREIANSVASCKEVQYAGICAGRYDVITWVVFKKLSDLRHFITVELGNIPGLRETDTAFNYKIVKLLGRLPMY